MKLQSYTSFWQRIHQAAITPQGELKMCVMIDYPKYKIVDTEVRGQRSEVRVRGRSG